MKGDTYLHFSEDQQLLVFGGGGFLLVLGFNTIFCFCIIISSKRKEKNITSVFSFEGVGVGEHCVSLLLRLTER